MGEQVKRAAEADRPADELDSLIDGVLTSDEALSVITEDAFIARVANVLQEFAGIGADDADEIASLALIEAYARSIGVRGKF